ncbi:MAG: hypothetical protein V1692_00435, partial [bacterium]
MKIIFNKITSKVLILSGVFLFGAAYVLAIDTPSTGYRVNRGAVAQSITINVSGICKKVTNNSPNKDLFVPTRTPAEWNAFAAKGLVTIGPCGISTCQELQNMKNDLSATYELANNIDCSDTINWNGGAGFEPIGNQHAFFTGKFDGKGFTINSLYINRPEDFYVGLFGINMSGEIKNIGLVNNITVGNTYTAG